MAQYIKIKKEDISISDNSSDFLIGGITLIKQGAHNGENANDVTVFVDNGKYFTFKVSTAGAVWTKALQSAATANPGGVVATAVPNFAKGVTPVLVTQITIG